MRPINLIPTEERRASATSSRTGPLAHVVVGALAALLVGVVMLVLVSNQISDREGEVEGLQAEKTAAVAEAEKLAPYVSFQQVTEQRTQTITELADSRFDWVRVIRQLSLVLPPGIYLTGLTGSARGSSEGAEGVSGRPSLTLAGCGPSQDSVAAFVAALREIDGVTRVGLNSSSIAAGEAGTSGASVCASGEKALFDVLVAFDDAPPSPDSGAASSESLSGSEASEGEGSEGEGSGSEGSKDQSSGEESGGEGSTASSTSTEPVG